MTTTTRGRLTAVALVLFGLVLGGVGGRLIDRGAEDDSAALSSRTGAKGVPTDFTISSLNVLGAGHTRPGGNRKGWAPGVKRMGWVVQLMKQHAVDVIGFQELQPPQLNVLERRTSTTYDRYPAEGPRGFVRNTIAWRSDTWTMVSGSWLEVPYFKGAMLRMPVVLLQHLGTGQQAYFMNFQNPANARGNASKWRLAGYKLQVGLVNRLRAETGLPVYWTGDLNERDVAYCKVTGGTDLESASGGTNDERGCAPARPTAVDWVFGAPETEFDGYVADRSALVKKATDHPMVVAHATLPPMTVPCPQPKRPAALGLHTE
jgi:hypothetical protein